MTVKRQRKPEPARHAPTPFIAYHLIDLTALLGAVDYALERDYRDAGGVLHHNRELICAALQRAEEHDRENQLAGGRAAND